MNTQAKQHTTGRHVSVTQKMTLWLLLTSLLTIALCMWGEGYLSHSVQNMQQPLDSLAASIQSDDWQRADKQWQELNADWQRTRRCWLGLNSHQDVANIDTAMLSLGAFLQRRQSEDAYNQLQLLRYFAQAPVEANTLSWSTIF
ncbi:MAG: DUF4363 family protein [Firmicutes bacterium]|nr:DUF4363 family protein [Bacillota bacterium]